MANCPELHETERRNFLSNSLELSEDRVDDEGGDIDLFAEDYDEELG